MEINLTTTPHACIATEGLLNALAGKNACVARLNELKIKMDAETSPQSLIRILREISHQTNSYAFWLEQELFWERRKHFGSEGYAC